MALSKPIDQITPDDLQRLVNDKEAEKQIVDYKKTISLDVPQKRDEFRQDISSFANASGGDYILGIDEKEGVAVELCGMKLDNQEAFKLRLEEILQCNIRPRIPGIQIRPILLHDDLFAVIVRVPRSFARPHQVTINGNDFRFWARNSSGKYRLDVDQLRSAFLLSETLEERIRIFRQDRLGSIIAGETPINISAGSKLVLHLVPLSAFEAMSRYDFSLFQSVYHHGLPAPERHQIPWPLNTSSANNRFNFDGILNYSTYLEGAESDSYIQIYHNGIIEAVNTNMVNREHNGVQLLNLTFCENNLIKSLASYLEFQRELGIDSSILIMLSLLNVKDRALPSSQFFFTIDSRPVDRDTLVVPGVMAEGNEFDASSLLRPIFDALWNAVGRPNSPNYDENGVWHQPSY